MRGVCALAIGLTIALSTTANAASGDLRVKVRNGNLVVRASQGFMGDIELQPTAEGYVIGPGENSRDFTINGAPEPLLVVGATRRWKIDLRGATDSSFLASAAPDGVERPRLRSLRFLSAERGWIELHGLEIERNVLARSSERTRFSAFDCEIGGAVRLDYRRATDVSVTFTGTRVGGGLLSQHGTADCHHRFVDSEIRGAARIAIWNVGKSAQELSAKTDLYDSSFGSLKLDVHLRTDHATMEVTSKRNTIAGRVWTRGDIWWFSDLDRIDSNLVLRGGNHGWNSYRFVGLSLGGKARIQAGNDGDSYGFWNSRLGEVRMRGGARGDTLHMIQSTVDGPIRFDGAGGGSDQYRTTGDASEARLENVEEIEAHIEVEPN